MNLSKREMVPVGTVLEVEALAIVLCCKMSSLPMTYLDLLLGSLFKARLNGIIERMEKRLVGWKKLYLSKGSRRLRVDYRIFLYILYLSLECQ